MSTQKTNRSVFVGFMDNKLDDKVAFWILYKFGGYDKHIVVLSGLNNMRAACGDLYDFLDARGVKPDDRPVVLEGHQFDESVAHERTFLGTQVKSLENYTSIEKHLKDGDRVDILQSAPIQKNDITYLINMRNIIIGNYQAIHGYNTSQVSTVEGMDNITATLTWLQGLQGKIHAEHPNANVRFTNNFASFTPSGASQPFESVVHLLPPQHLEAALKDPFPARQLIIAYDIINEAVSNNILQSKQIDGTIHEKLKGHSISNMDVLTDEIRIIRVDDDREGKKHFLALIDRIVALLEIVVAHYSTSDSNKNKLKDIRDRMFRVDNGVRSMFTKPLSVELCDANHVVAAMICDGRLDCLDIGTIKQVWKPMVFDFKDEKKEMIIFKDSVGYGHGTTIPKIDITDILRVMQVLLKT